MFKQLAILWVLVPSVVLSGCQGPNYRAIVTSPDAGAIVRAQQQDDRLQTRITVTVERVDGFFRYPAWQPAPLSLVLIDPGMRTLTVFGREKSKTVFCLDKAEANLQVMLRAGHVYEVKAERKGDEMTFWVEDAEGHELVGERQTTRVKTVLGPIGPI